MTIRSIMEAADALRSNRLGTVYEMKCLSELERQIFENIILRHEGYEAFTGSVDSKEAAFLPYERDDASLLAPEGFAPLYEAYLCAQIDLAQGEELLYESDMARFYEWWERFAAWYNETHLPLQKASICVSAAFERR